MKRVLYFDASAGVSGDMFVGALLDLGASLDTVKRHLAALGVEGFEVRARRVERRGLMGTKFDVVEPGTGRAVDEPRGGLGHGHGHEHHHGHEHDHSHGHGHSHGHDHQPDSDPDSDRDFDFDAGQGQGHGHGNHDPDCDFDFDAGQGHGHRGLAEIRGLIRGAGLPGAVADHAVAVFELLAEAEAKVHGKDPEEIHFHEVGALDSIADIVAAASAFVQLGADEAWCSPVHVGSGTVRCAHGVLPVPAPATLELLRGVPVYSDGVRGELATPTGAALVRHFCDGFCPMPPVVVEAVGYGAGSKDFGIPGLFRATLGTTAGAVGPSQAVNLG